MNPVSNERWRCISSNLVQCYPCVDPMMVVVLTDRIAGNFNSFSAAIKLLRQILTPVDVRI